MWWICGGMGGMGIDGKDGNYGVFGFAAKGALRGTLSRCGLFCAGGRRCLQGRGRISGCWRS